MFVIGLGKNASSVIICRYQKKSFTARLWKCFFFQGKVRTGFKSTWHYLHFSVGYTSFCVFCIFMESIFSKDKHLWVIIVQQILNTFPFCIVRTWSICTMHSHMHPMFAFNTTNHSPLMILAPSVMSNISHRQILRNMKKRHIQFKCFIKLFMNNDTQHYKMILNL